VQDVDRGPRESTLPQVGLGALLQWSAPDKCLLGVACIAPFIVAYLIGAYAYREPGRASYVDPAALEVVIRVLWGLLAVWAGLAALAWTRRGRPTGDWILHLAAQVYAIGFGVFSYLMGHYTSGYQYAVGLGGAVAGMIVFGLRPVLLASLSFLTILVVTTAAEQLGLVPYAPLLRQAPWSDGHLAPSWLYGLGGLPNLILWFALVLVGYVVETWRTREADLARTSDQLARANELISRYVAAQLAEQILAGNYGAVEKPERRRIVVFFSDIQGFTETADRVEPEELSRILNEYLTEMTVIAKRYSGMIDKFVGDAIMILFGAPQSTDDHDHALRAVRMAVEMQERMVDLREKWHREGMEEPFAIRIGVNTGHASVGNFGSRERLDYTAIGRQVNLAARLQVRCEPGKVLLSHSTWVLVRDEIPCTAKGAITVKGIHNPVNVYEVGVAPAEETPAED
jgi:adenylate cyclase